MSVGQTVPSAAKLCLTVGPFTEEQCQQHSFTTTLSLIVLVSFELCQWAVCRQVISDYYLVLHGITLVSRMKMLPLTGLVTLFHLRIT